MTVIQTMLGAGEWVLPYTGCIVTCGPKEYGYLACLGERGYQYGGHFRLKNKVSFCTLVLN